MTPRRSGRRAAAPINHLPRLIVAAAVGAALLLAPASALAATSGGSGHGGSLFSILPLGSIFSISDDLATIAKDIFSAFVHALMPASLTKDGVKLLTWLAALPSDPLGQTYKGVGTLESDMRDVGIALIPLTLSLSAARYTYAGLTGGNVHPIQSVVRVVGASFCLLVWPWFFNNVTAFINILTATIFSFADVHHGLTMLWTTMFGGSAAFGDFSGFAEILIIAAIALVVSLIILKVAILVLLAFLFVIGPVAIMLSPVPELSALSKLFGMIFTAAAIIPVGWALMFALGGAFIGSATQMPLSFSGIEHAFLALCAGLLCLVATLKWPTFIIGFAKSRIGAVAHTIGGGDGATGAAGAPRGGVASLPSRVAGARLALETGGRTFSRSLGAVGGAMGMPRGGALGAASRLPGRALNARRQAAVANEIKAGASAHPAAAWEAMYQHTQQNATFTRPRPIAAARRAAKVAAATPVAVAASMGSGLAQARVQKAAAPTGAPVPAPGGGSAGSGDPNGPRADVLWGASHLQNARAKAQVSSPSVRHELDADNARRSGGGSPPAPAAARVGAAPTPSSPSARRPDPSAPAAHTAPPRSQRPLPPAAQGLRGPAAAHGAPKPTSKPLDTATAARSAPAPRAQSRPAAPTPKRPAPTPRTAVPASPSPDRPDPRSDL